LEDDAVLFARIMFVPLSLLTLANCARQLDPANYALAKNAPARYVSLNERQIAKMDANYDGTTRRVMRDVPTVDVGKPTVDTELSRDTPETGIGRQAVPVAMTAVPPAASFSRAQNAKFLETLAKDDQENQLLKRKTNICRGC
jgi:hypothetical protein